jgi:subtilisin family serine protease
MTGTSQASPFVAGTIALWMQADTTLTIDDVKTVIAETSIKDDFVKNATVKEQWGAGKINVMGGLKYVLERKNASGIAAIADENDNMVVEANGGIINVFVAGESAITVAVYNMSGQVVRHVSVNDNEANVDVENLPKGIYLIHAQGAKGRYTTRMVI